MDRLWARLDAQAAAVGTAGASLIRPGDKVLTHCWATPFAYVLRSAILSGTEFEVFCTETRPYLQGARLTAEVVSELGIRPTVITDGMPAFLMAQGMISSFFAGADRVTMDGHLVNKIGTLGIAIAASHYRIPTYGVCLQPDRWAATSADVPLEERDADEVLYCRGVRTATLAARGYYPAFDVTPPELLTGFVTDRGVFEPGAVADYFLGS
jgi:methylthioribose-1-phosphate isomerase